MVPSARLGLKLLLAGLEIGAGDEIILPAWTYFAVPGMLAFCKVKPVFVDIDPDTCNMDISGIQKAITKKTRAIIATHLYGLPMEMDRVLTIAGENGVKVIEDCAQSFGATFDGRKTGSMGSGSFFSFGLTKNYTTINGGLIAVNDLESAEIIRGEMESFGYQKNFSLLVKTLKGIIMKFGTSPALFSLSVYPVLRLFSLLNRDIINQLFDEVPYRTKDISEDYLRSNVNAVQAKLGKFQLDSVDKWNMLRNKNGLMLSRLLDDQDGLRIIRNPEKSNNIYLSYPVQLKDRGGLKKFLLKRGIDSTEGFLRNCPTLSIFKEFYRDCPNSERLEREILHIPVYASLPEGEIQHIADSIKEFLSRERTN